MVMEMQKNTQLYILSLNVKKPAKRMFVATMSTVLPLIALLLIALSGSQNLRAADGIMNINEDPVIQQKVVEFIQNLADKALTTLNTKDTTLADQEIKFSEILTEGFNLNYIGRISLGRHRKKAASEDLEVYYALFPEYLVKVYSSRLTKLNTRQVRVGKVLPKGKRDMYVRTKVIDDEGKSYDVDWRVRPDKRNNNAEPGFKIIDVKIEGISMARTQRDDFAARISESGIAGLIDFMQVIVNETVEIVENRKVEETE